MKKKNIAIFVDNLDVGGIQRSIVNLLNNVDYSKCNIDLYFFNKKNFYDLSDKVNVIFLKKPSVFYKYIPFSISKKILKVDYLDKEYDLSIDFESYQVYTAVGALNCKSKKRVIWIHNDYVMKCKDNKKFRVLYTLSKGKYHYFDTFCAVSEGAMDSFLKLQNFKNKEFFIVPNFIDTNEIKTKLKDDCDLEVDSKKINIVSMGRLCSQKGFDLLLYNIKELLKYRKDFHLYIIGDGKLKNNIEKLILKLKINNYVTLLGNQKNPFKYMKKMDLFYLNSRYEGQGMVLLEAKSVGLDVLIPSYLEKYCPNIKGTNNIINYLVNYKKPKREKKFNDLKKYNDDVSLRINKLFNIGDDN